MDRILRKKQRRLERRQKKQTMTLEQMYNIIGEAWAEQIRKEEDKRFIKEITRMLNG